MAYQIKYDEARNLAAVRHFGTADNGDLWAGREAAMNLVRGKPTPRILADMREVSLETSTMEEFNFGRSQVNYGPGLVKVAVLVRKDDPKKEEHHLIETVGQNRGALMMVFEDRGAAETWLMS